MYAILGGGQTTITTLGELNAAGEQLELPTLAYGDFSQDGEPTNEEIDEAIANSTITIYGGDEGRNDIIEEVNSQLETITGPPPGYTLETDSGTSAYINQNGYTLDEQAIKLLISAANKQGSARHLTKNVRGNPNGAHAYIHAYGTNSIFGFTDDPSHRGYPAVTVVSTGDVTGRGVHRFQG